MSEHEHRPKEDNNAGHSHDGPGHHHHAPRHMERKRLWIVIVITFVAMIGEFVGGFLTNSLALLSDAFHMLTHVGALSVSLFSIVIATRIASKAKTFGYWRAEVISALFNGVTLLPILAYILWEAVQKFANPEPIDEIPMLVVAILGLAVNLIGAGILSGSSKGDLNVRGAFLHMLGDTASSVGVILAAATIHFTGWLWLDPAVSVLIAVVILVWSISLIRESVHILLEGTPKEVNLAEVEEAIGAIEGVEGLHDLHVWQITSKMYAMTAHILVPPGMELTRCLEILEKTRGLLDERFDIQHTTLELEAAVEETEESLKSAS